MAKVKILTSFNAEIGGKSVRFSAGDVVDIPDSVAVPFVNAGFMALVDRPASVKIVHKPEQKKAVKNGDN